MRDSARPPSSAKSQQTTAVSILDRLLHHATVAITDGPSYRMKDAQQKERPNQPAITAQCADYYLANSGTLRVRVS